MMGFLVAIVQLSLTVIKSVRITGNITYIYVCMCFGFFSLSNLYQEAIFKICLAFELV